MTQHKIVIKTREGQTLGVIDKYENLRWKHVLNREGDASFEVVVDDPKSSLIATGNREAYIYRDDDIVFGGTIRLVDGELSRSSSTMKVNVLGFFELLQKARSPANKDYTATDQSNILWDLINTRQNRANGDMGITQGTLTTSIDRDRKAYEYKNIYEAIIQMSEVQDGVDFEVSQTKEFNTWWPWRGEDLSDSVILKYGKNIESIRFTQDSTDLVNYAIVLGGGLASSKKIEIRQDTDLQASYGLQEDTVSYIDVEDDALIEAKGDIEIIQKGLPLREYEVVQTPGTRPEYDDVSVGDWIRISARRGVVQLEDRVRILTKTVRVQRGVEIISYTFQYN